MIDVFVLMLVKAMACVIEHRTDHKYNRCNHVPRLKSIEAKKLPFRTEIVNLCLLHFKFWHFQAYSSLTFLYLVQINTFSHSSHFITLANKPSVFNLRILWTDNFFTSSMTWTNSYSKWKYLINNISKINENEFALNWNIRM